MAVAKVIEITASSPKSFDDAVQEGIKRVSKTVDEIQGAWVNDMTVKVTGDKVSEYRVNLKVTFLVKD